ncbi:MAG: XdhC family protein, partial [Bacteroidia bacterium]|nr:XdhC family protein [Bacteroidia bacterium]
MKEIEKIIQAYDQIHWDKEKAALGTVVKVEESAYRRIGARMLVSSLGHWVGGISGGCLEGDALKRAQIAINKNQSSIVVYDTMDDDSHQIGVGLGCNGRIEVLFTPINRGDPKNPIEYLRSITATRKTRILLQVLSNDAIKNDMLGSFFPLDQIS